MVRHVSTELTGAEVLHLIMGKVRPPQTGHAPLKEEVSVVLHLVNGDTILPQAVAKVVVSYAEEE